MVWLDDAGGGGECEGDGEWRCLLRWPWKGWKPWEGGEETEEDGESGDIVDGDY